MSEEAPQTMTCYRHPKTPTLLRCSRCEQPICVHCAIQTPTGYRCPECVRNQQKVFDTAKATDYILSPIIAIIVAFAGSWFIARIGMFTIFLSPLVGILIATICRWVIQKRRSIRLFKVITAAAVVGSLPLLAFLIIASILITGTGEVSMYDYMPLIWQAVYTVLMSSSLYYRLR